MGLLLLHLRSISNCALILGCRSLIPLSILQILPMSVLLMDGTVNVPLPALDDSLQALSGSLFYGCLIWCSSIFIYGRKHS
jgi:hypothetical protein